VRKFLLGFMIAVVGFGRPNAVGAVDLSRPLLWNGPLSRAQAIARAMVAGFDVRAARADAEIARGQAIGQRSAVLPQVSVSGNAINANLPQFGMPVARQTYVSASVSVPIFNPSGSAGVRSATLSATASSEDLESVINDAAFAAVQAYDRAVLGAQVADARRVAVADQAANVRFVELRVRAGKDPRYLLARSRAGLASAQQMAEDAAAERDEAFNDLKLALDFDPASAVVFPDRFTQTPYDDSAAAATLRALRQRPDLAAAKARVEAARAGLTQAKAAYEPSAALTAQSYNGSSNPPLGASGGQVGVTVSLPTFDASRRGAIVEASAQLDKARAAFERQQLAVQDEVANAWRELEAASVNVQTAQAALNDALESLRVARLRQRAGKGIELEVLDALAVASNARENILKAQERYDLAVGGVRHATADRQT